MVRKLAPVWLFIILSLKFRNDSTSELRSEPYVAVAMRHCGLLVELLVGLLVLLLTVSKRLVV